MILNVIFVLLSLIGSALVWLCGQGLHPAWLLLVIPAFYVGITLLYFAVLFVASLLMPKRSPKKTSKVCRFFIWFTLRWLLLVMGIRVKLTGEEKLPDCPCVLVSNHRSDFDPMTVLAMLRHRKLAYISKESNFKIPIVGPFIRQAGFVAIDRGNGVRAVRTLQKAAARMQSEGVDIGIYPEGTRSKTGKLLRFKTGACYLAQEANAPIVVMTTQGTEKISKRFLFSPICVELNIVEVIDRETVQANSQNDLIARIRETVERNLPPETSEPQSET